MAITANLNATWMHELKEFFLQKEFYPIGMSPALACFRNVEGEKGQTE